MQTVLDKSFKEKDQKRGSVGPQYETISNIVQFIKKSLSEIEQNDLKQGTIVLGPTGSGKSLLINLLLGAELVVSNTKGDLVV